MMVHYMSDAALWLKYPWAFSEMEAKAMKDQMLRAIADGLFPGGMDPAKLTEIGKSEVRAAVEALLRIYEQDNARLTLALEQLDKAAAEIERLRAENARMAASFVTNQQVIKDATAAERERCAKIVENFPLHCPSRLDIAAAIRKGEP